MENILFKQIVKLILFLVGPLLIMSLLFFNIQLKIAAAFFIGIIFGIFRLKAFFSYITSAMNKEKTGKRVVAFIKYLASLIIALGAIAFLLLKSVAIGLAVIIGLITVPIIVTVYAMLKGISLFRTK